MVNFCYVFGLFSVGFPTFSAAAGRCWPIWGLLSFLTFLVYSAAALESFWGHVGEFWTFFGLLWSSLGSLLERSWCARSSFGALLALLGALLERSWRRLVGVLEVSWGILDGLGGDLKPCEDVSEALGGILGAQEGVLEAS